MEGGPSAGAGKENVGGGEIRRMSAETAHRMATGQVISSLAGAVKELLENAMDAAPRDVEVVVKNKGADLLEVRDSGTGVPPGDLDRLAKPHSTSKLAAFDDLRQVESFGFRGEALNALAALGRLTVTTRHASAPTATRLVFDSFAAETERKAVARQVGTTVSVRELFHALPVRRRELLKNGSREWRSLVAAVSAAALVASPVRFVLRDAARPDPVLATDGRGLLSNAQAVLGEAFATLLPLSLLRPSEALCDAMGASFAVASQMDITLEGYMSSYEKGSSSASRDRQFLYINRRPAEFPAARKLLNDLYRQFKKGSRHGAPVFIVLMGLPPDSIDVNVSADKREVLVSEERSVLAVLKASALAVMDSAGSHCPSLPQHNDLRPSVPPPDRPCPRQDPDRPYPRQDHDQHLPTDQTTVRDLHPQPYTSLAAFKHPSAAPSPAASGLAESSKPSPKAQTSLERFAFSAEKRRQAGEEDEGESGDSVRPDPKRRAVEEVVELGEPEERAAEGSKSAVSPEVAVEGERRGSWAPPRRTKEDEDFRKTRRLDFSMAKLRLAVAERREAEEAEARRSEPSQPRFTAQLDLAQDSTAKAELTRSLHRDDFNRMQVMGQFNLGFIIAALDGKELFVVDQHASDEKATYERLQEEEEIQSQRLYQPRSLRLTSLAEDVVMDNRAIFARNGFTFRVDPAAEAGSRVALTGFPLIGGLHFDEGDLDELISVLSELPGLMYRPTRFGRVFASRACRSSVMIGTALTEKKMREILQSLARLKQPWNCPHGRPTLRHLYTLKDHERLQPKH